MADEIEGLPVQEREVPPGEVPGPGAPGVADVDLPHADLLGALEAEAATLASGWEPQAVTLRLDNGQEATATIRQPIADREQRQERLQALHNYLTRQGERLLVDQNTRIVGELQAQRQQLEELAERLARVVPPADSTDLGDLGELSADEYRQGLNEELQQHRHVLAALRALQGQQEEFARRREAGGLAAMLEALQRQPTAAQEVAAMLKGTATFTVEPYTPNYQEPDFDLDSLRYKVQRRINKAEDVHRQLAERDQRRGDINAPTRAQLANYPAFRSRVR